MAVKSLSLSYKISYSPTKQLSLKVDIYMGGYVGIEVLLGFTHALLNLFNNIFLMSQKQL